MHEQDLAIVRGLVSVAWADGRLHEHETEIIKGLLEAYSAKPSEVREILEYAATPKSIDDIPITELSRDDRRLLLQHAVLIMHADGEVAEGEGRLLDELCEKLRIPDVEAKGIIAAAERRARALREAK